MMVNLLVVVLVFIVLIVTFLVVRKDFGKNLSNINLFNNFLQSRAKATLFHKSYIEGVYKDRRIWCKVFSGVRRAPVIYNPKKSHGFGLEWWEWRCPIYLCIEPKTQRGRKYASEWSGIPIRKYAVTEFTGLYDDGRIYYDYIDVKRKNQGYITCIPELDPQLDRKSLWALLGLKLHQEDIQFFLDELTKATEMVDKGEISKETNEIEKNLREAAAGRKYAIWVMIVYKLFLGVLLLINGVSWILFKKYWPISNKPQTGISVTLWGVLCAGLGLFLLFLTFKYILRMVRIKEVKK